jgi:hypothetical protein
VAEAMGWWDLVSAERLELVDRTEDLRAFLASGRDPLEALHEFAWTIAEIQADGDWLPVNIDQPGEDDARADILRVTARDPMWFSALDVVGAQVKGGGKAPEVLQAVQVVPVGQQAGLRHGDPVPEWVRRRQALKKTDVRRASALGIATNALVYGKAAERQTYWHRPSKWQAWEKKEKAAPWCFFPLATSVTAGVRLLMVSLEADVRAAGGRMVYGDTDSLFAAGVDADDFQRLLKRYDGLFPWTPTWKTDPRIRSILTTAKKRHVNLDAEGNVVRMTESGLGGSWVAPRGWEGSEGKYQRWSLELARCLVAGEQAPFEAEPAIRRIQIVEASQTFPMGKLGSYLYAHRTGSGEAYKLDVGQSDPACDGQPWLTNSGRRVGIEHRLGDVRRAWRQLAPPATEPVAISRVRRKGTHAAMIAAARDSRARPERQRPAYDRGGPNGRRCQVCGAPLVGKQELFCRAACKATAKKRRQRAA